MITKKRPFGPRDGNAMLETSLCFMLFMTIFLAIMEFGWAVYNYNFVSYAAREGVRYAATRGSQCQSPCTQATADIIQTLIRNQAVVMDASQIAVDTTYPDGNKKTPGNRVTVNVSYPVPPLLGWLVGGLTTTASSTMRIAQ
jgi:Flp pilus assembly protein TadG